MNGSDQLRPIFNLRRAHPHQRGWCVKSVEIQLGEAYQIGGQQTYSRNVWCKDFEVAHEQIVMLAPDNGKRPMRQFQAEFIA